MRKRENEKKREWKKNIEKEREREKEIKKESLCDYNQKLYILNQVIILNSKLVIDREGDRERDTER